MHNNFTEEQIEQVLKEHPLLRYNSQKRMFFGKLVTDPTDEDYYEVEIHIDTFPQKFPIVREMEDRIPRKADRHMYSITGNCCFTTQAKEQILLLKEIFSLNTFIKKIVVPFFQNNSYYEINKKYKYGSYSHGPLGNIEGYRDIFGIYDLSNVISLLLNRIVNKTCKAEDKCYCSSGLKLQNCHISNYNDLLLVNPFTIRDDLNNYFMFIKNNKTGN